MSVSPIAWGLLAAAAASGLVFLRARPVRPVRPLAATKVLATLLIGGVLALGPSPAPVPLWPFALAIAFSAAGDAFLLDSERLFLQGLLSFLLAHVLYALGFWGGPGDVLPLALLGGAGVGVYAFLWKGLGKMRVPVAVYVSAIVVMGWQAWGFSALAGLGATVFMVSDALIAIDRFHAPVKGRDWWILGTYWIGQAGLVLGAVQGPAGGATA